MRDLAPDAVHHQTFDWLYQLVCAIAQERPLCLVLEDLHWSDEATLSLLDELLPAAEQTPIGFLLVHRSDPDHPAWHLVDRARRRFRRLFVELELEPLPEADARALAEADAGRRAAGGARAAPRRAHGRQPLLRRRGDPRSARARRARARERPPRARRRGLHPGRAPGGTAGAARPARRRGARAAHDRRRDRALLRPAPARAAPPRARLLPTLSELQWLQLVVEERSGAAPEYRFRHGLVQEAAYGTLVEARRRELHLRVGEALVELHRDSPAEVYGLLAHHFAEADEPERAVEYLVKAGDAARAVYAEEEAIELYRRALGFMERTGDEARARPTLLKIALTHHLAFDFRAANEAFAEAFARPAPAPRAAGAERALTWAMPAAWDGAVAPGHSYSDPGVEVTRNLFRGLVAIGRDLDIEPDLAERFTVSDDGRSYRFTLRRDARWSDGAPVTADDFAFTFARMAEDDVAAASWLDGVSGERHRRAHARDPAARATKRLPLPARPAAALRLAAARLRAGGT